MISIDLKEKLYVNENYDESDADLAAISEDIAISLSEMMPPGMYQSLLQKKEPATIDMKNKKNLGFEGNFWFGNPSQKMQVIFDTGSSIAWLFSESCQAPNCPAKNEKYHQSKSSQFKDNKKGGQMLKYGKGIIAGHPSEDRACFNDKGDACMSKLHFLTVFKSRDLESLQGSGLVGLAPMQEKNEGLDPLQHGIGGFIAQVKKSPEFNEKFEQIFSLYLSNKENIMGKITFGGYDLKNFAKQGMKESDVFWMDQSINEAYWAVNSKGARFGQKTLVHPPNQQVILDNGMSFAMAPKSSFLSLVKTLAQDHKMLCMPNAPVWSCTCSPEQLNSLPSLEFDLIQGPNGKSKTFKMPPPAYIMPQQNPQTGTVQCFLLLTPWDFKGLGAKQPGEDYWVLGAQFLKNYYSIYDFKQKKIGLVESVSSMLENDEK